MSKFGEYACFTLSRHLLSKNKLGRYSELACAEGDVHEYDQWRTEALRKQLQAVLQSPLAGRTVVDFGCGGGMLSAMLVEAGAQKVYGIESSLEILDTLRKTSPKRPNVEFMLGETSKIPLPDSSVDLIFCISVLEHVIDVDSILKEWYRILRNGGQVLIAWSGWGHPDASHLASLIPIPYAQCIFSERTLARTAARIRSLNIQAQRSWWAGLAGETPEDRENNQYCDGFLNKMTIGQFNKRLAKTKFEVTEHKCHPPSWIPQIHPLFVIPFFREHLTSFSTYALSKHET